MNKYNIGIDLGTTNIVCCTMNKNKFDIIKVNRKETMPSVLLYKNGEIVTGNLAKKKAVSNAENFIKSSKTYIGDNTKRWEIEGKIFTPEDVATEFLKNVDKGAKDFFKTNEQISAVITVPAYFTSKQRAETKKAAEKAGLKVKDIITEPMAAAIACGFEDDKEQTIFVVDLGGGTFDVSILNIKDNIYETIAIDGNKQLGGDDFDNIIIKIFMKAIRKEYGIDLSTLEKSSLDSSEYYKVMQRLNEEAEQTKIYLSEEDLVDVIIANLFNFNGEFINLNMKITKSMFEKESAELLFEIAQTIKRCLNNSDVSTSEIDKVILVGGSTNIPAVKELVKRTLEMDPYANKDLAKLVAMGASLKACEEHNNIKINDIVAHSLGIGVVDDKFSIIIPKNTRYPVEITEEYTTSSDYQQVVSIKVFEGEDNLTSNNEFYGGFELSGLEHALNGIPKINVTFKFDKDQILHVTAVDKMTNSSESKKININRIECSWKLN